jgi:hypothetical protein
VLDPNSAAPTALGAWRGGVVAERSLADGARRERLSGALLAITNLDDC